MGETMRNIVANHNFEQGLQSWSSNCCSLKLHSSSEVPGMKACSGNFFSMATNRTACWQGIEQTVTQLKANVMYEVIATVCISGSVSNSRSEMVMATLRLDDADRGTQYVHIGRVQAFAWKWENLYGKFKLETIPKRVVFYVEGPPAGVDLLLDSVQIRTIDDLVQSGTDKQVEESREVRDEQLSNIVKNPAFEDGLEDWTAKCCTVFVSEFLDSGNVFPRSGKHFAVATNRRQSWQGIEQVVTGRIEEGTLYHVLAIVRIRGRAKNADVLATLWMETHDSKQVYMTLGSVQASNDDWAELKGEFLVNKQPKQASVYLEGPPADVDILVDSVSLFIPQRPEPAGPPVFEDPKFGVNIVKNNDFAQGLSDWCALGSCRLMVGYGGPTALPSAAQESLNQAQLLINGSYILATNRTSTWEGPSQTITDRVQLFLPYQVTAWVRVRFAQKQLGEKHKVNVALSVDGAWVTGGEVEADSTSWKEVMGAFRLEKKAEAVSVYVQGPCAGVDIMISGLQIFAVDRLNERRVAHLRGQCNKVRKRDVVLKAFGAQGEPLPAGVEVRIQQIRRFPLGTCINHYSLENKSYVKFLLEQFNWAVFENEIKWGWTEKSKGELSYSEADEMIVFCMKNNIPCRGHCILWETEQSVQDWLKNLSRNELAAAVQDRVVGLLSRYCGKFLHYDVNNEMLHGSFYKDRLGPGFLSYVFKLAKQLDPEPTLFVNDYHVEDGCDCNSSPEKYIEQIQGLQLDGALVGGIGVQGHIDVPVGPILCNALDKLGVLCLPIWLTEVDVCSKNEFVRADDLEVVLREAFAHPSVEGIMLWGFLEGAMCRKNGHLLDSDNRINEAGRRFIALKQEWTTNFVGQTDEQGEVKFHGFHGAYSCSSVTGKSSRSFEVTKGDGQQIVEVYEC